MNPIQQAIEALAIVAESGKFQCHDDKAWDVVNDALTSLRSLQKEVEGVELPKPYDLQHDDAGRPVVLYTADQLRTAVAAALGQGAVPEFNDALWGLFNEHDVPMRTRDAIRMLLYAAPSPEATQPEKQPRGLLSSRLRPGVECAPWVIDEVQKLERAIAAALSAPEARATAVVQVPSACTYPDCTGKEPYDGDCCKTPVMTQAPLERRDWVQRVRDDILYPLAHRESDELSPIAEGLGQSIPNLLEMSAPEARAQSQPTQAEAPIDMVLYCPNCGKQHIDEPERFQPEGVGYALEWTNPPHRSHLCHDCGCIWRPADVPTNGVAHIETKGKADTWVGKAPFAAPAEATQPTQAEAESERETWPVMPPSKGQSPILFEDGYAEGWAKCLAACQEREAALAAQQAGQGEALKRAAYEIEQQAARLGSSKFDRTLIADQLRLLAYELRAALATPPAPQQPEARKCHYNGGTCTRRGCAIECQGSALASRSAQQPEALAQQERDREDVLRWCWYHDGDERVPVLDSEEEAHAEAQQWINNNCEPGEEHEYLVAPMKNGLQMLPSAGHIATAIIEDINNGLSDEMGAEEWPLEFSKEDITALGEVVRSFIQSRGSVQWWTVDHTREAKHTSRAARSSEGGV